MDLLHEVVRARTTRIQHGTSHKLPSACEDAEACGADESSVEPLITSDPLSRLLRRCYRRSGLMRYFEQQPNSHIYISSNVLVPSMPIINFSPFFLCIFSLCLHLQIHSRMKKTYIVMRWPRIYSLPWLS